MSNLSLRLDKLLWYLRLASSRSVAQALIAAGHIRVNGRRAVKSAALVLVGDVLTLPLRNRVLIIEILDIPQRRGPTAEAAACYRTYAFDVATDSQDDAVP